MKILLIQSNLGGHESPVYPLGLACLIPGLKDHSVQVFDPNLPLPDGGLPDSWLSDLIGRFKPDLIGISLRNIDSTNKRQSVYYYEEFVRLVSLVSLCSSAVIVVGGSGFSLFAETIMLTCSKIDFGVYLEGETIFPALLDNLNTPERVPNVYYRKNNRIFFSGPNSGPDFRFHSDPDMEIVPLVRYLPFPEAIGVETKRGCPLSCVYCPYGFLNGRTYRLRNPVRIVDSLENMVSSAGLKRFTFTDSIFNIPRSHAEAILQEMVRRGLELSWSAWFSERNLDEALVRLAIKAGCRNFIFSPDGYADGVLKRLGKQLSCQDIEKAFALMSGTNGCEISYNFFKNPPGQTLRNAISMILFCFRAKWRMGNRVHFEFNSLRIEPHTRLFDLAVAENMIRENDDVLKPTYYSQKKTTYIETLMNVILRLTGK